VERRKNNQRNELEDIKKVFEGNMKERLRKDVKID
jgi:hypothetical protein